MSDRVRQAVVLAAGFGTRLGHLVKDIPKVMVPLGGKPLLQWHVEQLRRHGVEEIFFNLHYLPEVVQRHFGDGLKFGVKIRYAVEKEILGTAGGVKNFEKQLDPRFFLVYGDVFCLLDYAAMAEAYARRENPLAMVVIGDSDHPKDSDLVEIDSQERFLRIHRKPHAALPPRYKSMRGVYLLDRRLLGLVPAGKYYEMDHQLLPDALARGERIYGFEAKDYIKDIGTPERYQEAQRAIEHFQR